MSSARPVLLLSRTLDLGGSERQLTEIAKGLDRAHFTPHVAAFNLGGIRADELRRLGIPLLHLPVTSFLSFSALRGGWNLIRYLRRHRIELVHTFDVPLNIFGAPFAKMAKGPVVLTSQRAHRDLTPGLHGHLLRVTDQIVDGIVVNCLHMRDHLISDERVAPSLIHLCYNGIDLQVFHPDREVAALPFEVPPGGCVIGVVCALRPEKGLATLLEGFSHAYRTHPNARLLIVGSGPMLAQLEAQAEELDIRSACFFVPKTADVAPWIRAMDIFVLPSLSEALSNSLMEAMACGCCAVATRVGGNPELVGEDERGLLFPKSDALALGKVLDRLIAEKALRLTLAKAGLTFICEGFSQPQSVRRMGEIYNSFLSSASTHDEKAR